MKDVLDTRFLIAHFFSDDPKVLDWTRKRVRVLRRADGLLPTLVLAEFFDQVCRRAGRREAQRKCDAILASGLAVVSVTADVALRAGRLRCSNRGVPLADCVVAAVAVLAGGRVVSDDPHFRRLPGIRTTWR